MIYGVVLAFTIVTAWEHFSDAEQLVLEETALVRELARVARAFPSESGMEIEKDLLAYTISVIEDEWPEMAHHGQLSVKTQAVYEDLWQNSYTIVPETPNQTAFLAEYLDRINQLSATRRMRLMYSRARVHNVLWLVMVAGAFPLVGYTLILCTKHTWIHVSITAAMTGLVVLCLYVAASLQLPFSGSVAVDVQPFEDLQTSLEKRISPLPGSGTFP